MSVGSTTETMKTQKVTYGHKAVGVAAVQLTNVSQELIKGVLIRAPGSTDTTPNTDPVWVGNNASVTADYHEETGGMPIVPGAALFLPVENLTDIWLISTAGSQDVAWMGV